MIHQVILEPHQRSKDVPEDTAKVPLEAWIKGWAVDSATVGEEVQITTLAGRTVKGRLVEVNPGFTHTYGPAVPELAPVGRELRTVLKEAKGRG
ncbi:MAG TPA: 2-amino-4-ketopentanoate thiolase [Firmicutes bacterium]|nr:2-amino-4-ketopentanoate thiolase [Candidatus Fermentithermobacillaceae bacterium]